MKKVLVFGTFDIFHEGHRNFLKQARKHGEFLRVVVARDATVLKVKGRLPRSSEQQRADTIRKSRLADEVVLGNLNDKYAVVRDFKPDVICLGYDQEFFTAELRRKLNESGLERTKIIRLEPFEPDKYKSSLLRRKMEEGN
ncbi:MAG TPA: adenylyltransferase/cytidyltransferase family protein [Patescibacteria group bacterium]